MTDADLYRSGDPNRRASAEMLTGNLAMTAEHGRRADRIVTSMLTHSRGRQR